MPKITTIPKTEVTGTTRVILPEHQVEAALDRVADLAVTHAQVCAVAVLVDLWKKYQAGELMPVRVEEEQI